MNRKNFRKRALAVAAATVTTASALSLGMGGTTNAGTFPLGDVNLDGKVDLMDAQLALKGALRIDNLDSMQFKAADVNRDNKVDLMDAQMILKGALRIEKIEGEISDTTPTTPPTTTEKPETSETPTETTVPTTPPAIQPTEVIKTTLEDGTVVITTPDEGIEGVDWEWRTGTGNFEYCHCGKLIGLDEHGYISSSDYIWGHIMDSIAEAMGSLSGISSDEEFKNAMNANCKCSGYVARYTTLSYKVKLK